MGILDVLKKNPKIRKIFGKKEISIIEKQLLGINLRPSEITRLSRDIRKKFEAIKELSRFQDEFELKKGEVVKQIVEEAKQEILNDKLRSKIKEIWLFGSSVDKTRTFRSDIDMAVLFDEIDKKEAGLFRVRIFGKVPDNLDVQVFNILPDKIKKSILKSHKILYKNE